MISNASSLEQITLQRVHWSGSGTPHGYPTTFSNLKVIAFFQCTNNRLSAWVFAAAATRWTPAVRESPIPLTTSAIMQIWAVFFDDRHSMAAEKVCDCDGDDYTFCATAPLGGGSIAFVTAPPPAPNEERADQFRVLRSVAFSMYCIKAHLPNYQLEPRTRTKRLEDWASLDCILSELVHLQSIDLFGGTRDAGSGEAFNNIVNEMCSLLPKVKAKIHGTYNKTVKDGRELALALFGTKWRDWDQKV